MLSRSKCMRVAEVVARNPLSEVREALQRLQAGPPLPGAAGLRPGRFPWRVIAPPRHPRTRFLPTCASSGWTSRSAQKPGPQVLRVPGRIPAGLRWEVGDHLAGHGRCPQESAGGVRGHPSGPDHHAPDRYLHEPQAPGGSVWVASSFIASANIYPLLDLYNWIITTIACILLLALTLVSILRTSYEHHRLQ